METGQFTPGALQTLGETKANSSEIDRLANALSFGHTLLNELEEKLSMVSDRSGRDPETPATEQPLAPHLSTLVNNATRHNARLERLINELVL